MERAVRGITYSVMPALVAGIHVFKHRQQRRGWPGQARP
jgi:hypothetical protein